MRNFRVVVIGGGTGTFVVLRGHNLGNLILTGLRDLYGSEPKALEKAVSIFKISGRILPVSLQKTTLVAVYEDGKRLAGEHEIDQPRFGGGKRIKRVFLRPEVRIYRKVFEAIAEADLIVMGPGDLYTSTIPCLLISGMKWALLKSKAKLCYALNLVNRYSQTYKFKASDYVKEIERYSGKPLDFVLLSSSKIPRRIEEAYRQEKGTVPLDDLQGLSPSRVIRTDLARRRLIPRLSGDSLVRSFFRHDEDKLARALIKILL